MTIEHGSYAKKLGESRVEAPVNRRILSDRERQVVLFAAKGYDQKQTADVLGLSPKTVKNYRGSAFRKLGVGKIEAATMVTLRLGEITPEEVLDGIPLKELVARLSQLTHADKQLLAILTDEERTDTKNAQLAIDLFLSYKTVKNRMSAIARKLNLSGRKQVPSVILALKMI